MVMVLYFAYYDTLLQNATDIITKRDNYFIEKCDKSLYQNASVFFITKCDSFITKSDFYYEMPRHRDETLFFYLSFLSQTFAIRRTAGEGRGYFLNSSLPLPLAPQTLRHYWGDYCRELISTRSWQPDLNREA